MAISADGLIAGPNDETPWSDDEWRAFREFVRSCDVVLLGRRTYEIMKNDGEFVDGPEYIVVTNDRSLDTWVFRKASIEDKADMPQVERLGVIGGGELNGRLAKLGVIDEITLDVESVLLGAGTRLFGSQEVSLELEQIGSRRVGPSAVQNHYKVVQ